MGGRPTGADGVSPAALGRASRARFPHLVRCSSTCRACGVCRTDLHLAEGDLAPRRPPHRPRSRGRRRRHRYGAGLHQVRRRRPGRDRLAAPHLRHLPLVPSRATRTSAVVLGSPGGTPTAATPSAPSSPRTSPTASRRRGRTPTRPRCCAPGIIGYRALRLASLPEGGQLGIYGFGASAHLTAQVALHQGATVHVMTRSPEARAARAELGCASAGDTFDAPPEPLDSAIIFAPAGEIVPAALEALDDAGTLAIAGIHLSDVPVAQLPAAPVPRTRRPLGHGQHPSRRRGVPARRRVHAAAGAPPGVPPRPGRPSPGRPRGRPRRRGRGPHPLTPQSCRVHTWLPANPVECTPG